MQRDAVFPRWQGAFLALFVLADGLYLPASPAACWSLAAGTLAAALLTACWLCLLTRLHARDLQMLCHVHLPRALQIGIFGVLGALAIAALVQTLIRLTAFWQATAFPGIPRFIGAAVILFVGWRAGRRGRTATAMWAYPTVFLVAATLTVSFAVTLPDCEPAYLPELWQDFTISIQPGLRMLWLVLPLSLCVQSRELSATHACVRGVLLGGLGLAALSLRAYLVLGMGACQLLYPAFSAAGVFSVGDFLQRGEVLLGVALVLCEIVRAALLFTMIGIVKNVILKKKA